MIEKRIEHLLPGDKFYARQGLVGSETHIFTGYQNEEGLYVSYKNTQAYFWQPYVTVLIAPKPVPISTLDDCSSFKDNAGIQYTSLTRTRPFKDGWEDMYCANIPEENRIVFFYKDTLVFPD